MTMLLNPVADLDELRAIIGPHEPHATQMLSIASSYGLGRRVRAEQVIVEGETAGVVLHRRFSWLRWESQILLIDERGASGVAAAVDAGPSVLMSGFESHCRPVAEALDRLEGSVEIRDVFLVEPGFDFIAPDESTRIGTGADVAALVDLFWETGGHPFLHRHELRRWFKHAVAHDQIYVVDDSATGAVIGFGQFVVAGRYGDIAELTVHADRRAEGAGLRIIARMAETAIERGIGGIAILASTNPIPIPPDVFHSDPWWLMKLWPPRRFPGERRIRGLLTDVRQRRVPTGPDQPIFRPGDASSGPGAADALQRWRSN